MSENLPRFDLESAYDVLSRILTEWENGELMPQEVYEDLCDLHGIIAVVLN